MAHHVDKTADLFQRSELMLAQITEILGDKLAGGQLCLSAHACIVAMERGGVKQIVGRLLLTQPIHVEVRVSR